MGSCCRKSNEVVVVSEVKVFNEEEDTRIIEQPKEQPKVQKSPEKMTEAYRQSGLSILKNYEQERLLKESMGYGRKGFGHLRNQETAGCVNIPIEL